MAKKANSNIFNFEEGLTLIHAGVSGFLFKNSKNGVFKVNRDGGHHLVIQPVTETKKEDSE